MKSDSIALTINICPRGPSPSTHPKPPLLPSLCRQDETSKTRLHKQWRQSLYPSPPPQSNTLHDLTKKSSKCPSINIGLGARQATPSVRSYVTGYVCVCVCAWGCVSLCTLCVSVCVCVCVCVCWVLDTSRNYNIMLRTVCVWCVRGCVRENWWRVWVNKGWRCSLCTEGYGW